MFGRVKYLLGAAALLVLVGLIIAFFLWRAADNRKRRAPFLWAVAFSSDGKTAVTAGAQGPPRLKARYGELVFWNTSNGQKKRIVRVDWGLRGLAFAPNGQFIVTGNAEGHTAQIDPANGRTMTTWPRHFGVVNSVAISADSRLVAAGSFDSVISVWPVQAGEPKTIQVPDGMVDVVAFSPDAHWLAAGTRTGKVDVFDLAHDTPSLALEATPKGTGGNVDALAFSADGRSLVTSCGTNLRVWDTSDYSLTRELPGCEDSVTGLAFSPDGKTLALTDDAGDLSLWKWSAGEKYQSVNAHAGSCFGLAYSLDGKRIATCGVRDGCLRIWDASTLRPLASGRR